MARGRGRVRSLRQSRSARRFSPGGCFTSPVAAPGCFTGRSLPFRFAPPRLQPPLGVSTPQRGAAFPFAGYFQCKQQPLGKILAVTGSRSLLSRFLTLLEGSSPPRPRQPSSTARRRMRFALFALDPPSQPAPSLLDAFCSGCGEGSPPACAAAVHAAFVLALLRLPVQSGRFSPLRSSYAFALGNSHLTALPACDMPA